MVYLHDKYSPNKNIPENPTTSRYDSCESTGKYNIWPLGTKNQSYHIISFAQDVSWARHWWLITCCCYFCVERRVIDESSSCQTYAELIACLIDWLLDWLIDWLTNVRLDFSLSSLGRYLWSSERRVHQGDWQANPGIVHHQHQGTSWVRRLSWNKCGPVRLKMG